MLKIKNKTLLNKGFQDGCMKLSQQRLPVKAAFDLKTMLNRLEVKLKDANKVRVDLFQEYCQKDEKGNLLPNIQDVVVEENGKKVTKKQPVPGSAMAIEATKDEFEKKLMEFTEHEHEVKGTKLDLLTLGNVEISVNELMILEPIIDCAEKTDLNLV